MEPLQMDHAIPIIIAGAGLGGLAAAIQLKQAGFENITIFEKASKVGGTWAQNTYPGCSCDVPVALYQYSFAPAIHWTNTYPTSSEMQTYCEQLVTQFGLAEHLHLMKEIRSARWDASTSQWQVTLDEGAVYQAGILIGALGQLNRPMTPAFEGQDNFKGPTMHSATWNHDVNLTGKKVGVIGAAASAVQLIPEVAKVASHLTVFQRRPNYIAPRNDRPIRASEVAMLMSSPEAAMDIGNRTRQLTFDTADTFFWQAFKWTPEGRAAYSEVARDHLERQVPDPALRAKLTPDYPAGCKRILFTDTFYPALCLPHVTLQTNAIERFDEKGIITSDGMHHDLDVIVYATGFETTGWHWSMQVTGNQGQHLDEVWREGPRAYLGVTTVGFPNFFMLYGPHTNLGHNSITYMLEKQIAYIVQSLEGLSAQDAKSMSVTSAAQDRFFADLQNQLAGTVWADPTCNSWYKNDKGEITQNWGGSCTEYAQAVAKVKWADYEVA
jgi:cation diffusion facilitator CzcD-associated flavoprotein CzcO